VAKHFDDGLQLVVHYLSAEQQVQELQAKSTSLWYSTNNAYFKLW